MVIIYSWGMLLTPLRPGRARVLSAGQLERIDRKFLQSLGGIDVTPRRLLLTFGWIKRMPYYLRLGRKENSMGFWSTVFLYTRGGATEVANMEEEEATNLSKWTASAGQPFFSSTLYIFPGGEEEEGEKYHSAVIPTRHSPIKLLVPEAIYEPSIPSHWFRERNWPAPCVQTYLDSTALSLYLLLLYRRGMSFKEPRSASPSTL